MKKTLLASAIILATVSSAASATWTSEDGRFNFKGHMRINVDYKNYDQGFGLTDNNKSKLSDGSSRLYLAGIYRETTAANNFVEAKGQLGLKTNGDTFIEDAYVSFGGEDSWMIQLGRYEAIDLFPVGDDKMLQFAGGSDGLAVGNVGVQYYKVNAGRGRAGDAGQARIVKEFNNITAEVSTIYGDASDLSADSATYYDSTVIDANVTSTDKSFLVRPAVNYKSDDGTVSVSFGGEWEANKDTVTLTDSSNNTIDISDRYGLGATTTLKFGDLSWTTSAAYQDLNKQYETKTANTNLSYNLGTNNSVFAGVMYTTNDFEAANLEDAKSYAVYTTYNMPLMDLPNTVLSFAASYSDSKNLQGVKDQNDKVTAFRTRIQYNF